MTKTEGQQTGGTTMADKIIEMYKSVGRMLAVMRGNQTIRESERQIMATTENDNSATIPSPPPSAAKLNDDGLTYDAWKDAVNDTISDATDGLSLDDFPDRNTWDAWHDGQDPDEFAEELLEKEGF